MSAEPAPVPVPLVYLTKVTAPSWMDPKVVGEILQQFIAVGQTDAAETVDDLPEDEPDADDAKAAGEIVLTDVIHTDPALLIDASRLPPSALFHLYAKLHNWTTRQISELDTALAAMRASDPSNFSEGTVYRRMEGWRAAYYALGNQLTELNRISTEYVSGKRKVE